MSVVLERNEHEQLSLNLVNFYSELMNPLCQFVKALFNNRLESQLTIELYRHCVNTIVCSRKYRHASPNFVTLRDHVVHLPLS